jgi:hypothetical protein
MRPFLKPAVVQLGAIALAFTAVVRPVSAGGELVSLSHLAPMLGYTYTWIGSESAVALTRPGLYVLVRTGNPLYDVNDAVESTAQAPLFRNNDMYIGSKLVARLRSLAIRYAEPTIRGAPAPAGPIVDHGGAHGVLTLAATPTTVSDAVMVRGSGPPNVPLTITLSADITRELPRVVLSRTNIETDAAGKFSVQISTAPLYLQNSTILISATSLPGVTEAQTSFVLGQTSPNIAHPVDELPRDFKPH